MASADLRRGRRVRPVARDPELRRGRRDGEAVRLRVDRRGDRVDRRRARPLAVAREHAAIHDVVPGADHAARPRQPERGAARVPRAPARGLPRGALAPRAVGAARLRALGPWERSLLGLVVHGYVDAVSMHAISAKVEAGERIDSAEAATLWRHAPDEELQRLAGLVRARYHAP